MLHGLTVVLQPMIDPAHRAAWLNWLASERRYGANTLDAYERDLDDFTAYLATHDGPYGTIISRHIFRLSLIHI